ncbi:MAG TPA: hypothetical protein VIN62_00615 [Candidatus Cryosericum sp.]
MTTDAATRLVLLDILLYAAFQTIRIGTDRLLPASWINPDSWYFRPKTWERGGRFYEDHFHINRWKDRLPAVDGFNAISKKRLGGVSADYLRQFVVETCRGESHHVRTIVETAVFALWNPPSIFWAVFIIGGLCQLPFIMVQRYNRPRLEELLAEVVRSKRASSVSVSA